MNTAPIAAAEPMSKTAFCTARLNCDIKTAKSERKSAFCTTRWNRSVKKAGLYGVFWKIVCALPLLAVFVSCASVPTVPNPMLEESQPIPLENGASIYIFAEVKEARPILDALNIPELNNGQARQMLDRTNTAVIAFYPETGERRFQVAAWGSYPAAGANTALSFNKGWKKRRSETGPYWYSAAERLSVSLDSRQAFVTSWTGDRAGAPVTTAGIESPEGFADFRKGAALSFWMDNPGQRISRIIELAGIPLQVPADRVFISLFAKGGQYEALIKLRFPSPSQARAFYTIFTLARAMAPGLADSPRFPAQLLFANLPVLDGRDLNLASPAMETREIALLMDLFLVK
jgi:hypothetical protein